MRAALAVAAVLALPSLAAAHDRGRHGLHVDGCAVEASDGDRVARRGDLVVEPGERAGDVVALQGNVVVKAGATVDGAVAIGGDVVVEPGATVHGSAVAIDGDVRVARDARVDDDAFSVGGKVRVARGGLVSGDTGSLSAVWGGTALAKAIADEVAEECGGVEPAAVEPEAP